MPPPSLPPQPAPEWLGELALPDGTVVRFRHVCAADERLIAAAINSASRETLLHRFFSPIRRVSPEQLRRMLHLDPNREACLVGVRQTASELRIICGARYVKLHRPRTAEIAITVLDDFQSRGLGSQLIRLLARLAMANEIDSFEAVVLSSNHKMLRLLRKLTHGQARGHWTGDVHQVEIPVRLLIAGQP